MSATISLYTNIKQTKGGKEIPVDVMLAYIHDGKWQDDVLAVRTGRKSKEELPYVTMSGKFAERKIAGLLQHSGIICIDIDDIDVEEVKSLLCCDKYVYSCFTSVSGKGLAVLFKINFEKHNEAFEGLQQYLYVNYEIIVDPSCRDVSRARFVSYDPHIYINDKAEKFTQYPKKEKVSHKVPDVIFVQDDFDTIVQEIVSRRIDITGDYLTWIKLGFAITDKFGIGGKNYFHQISQFHPSYSPKLCERQFDNCLKAKRSGVTIASFYYHAKLAGIRVTSELTRTISQTAYLAKKGHRTAADTIKLLTDTEGITPEQSADIVNQVFDGNIVVDVSDSPIEALETWLKQNYSFRRNSITRYIENRGNVLQAKDLNSIYISAAKVFEKTSYELLERLINSDFTMDYNPLINFFEENKDRNPTGTIKALFETVETDTGMSTGEFCPNFAEHFGTKWIVGIVASIFGKHNPLMLVLSGNQQNTGKTHWFRYLLPKDLKPYYAESKLDAGKDDEILMTQKILIVDDEMGGKSKAEISRLKELTSKEIFSLREPYGRNNVDLKRLASLAGTTNNNEILNDPSGNRRVIPLNVLSIDQGAYNAIDKVDVFIEAYQLYINPEYRYELTSADIKILNDNTTFFEQTSAEFDLICKFYSAVTESNKASATFLSSTEIKARMERETLQRLNSVRIGMELKKLGFERIAKKVSGVSVRGYYVVERSLLPGQSA